MKKKVSKNLNKKEYNLYFILKEFIEKNNYSPSYRELLKLSDYTSVSTIYQTILKFEDLGYIKVDKDENGRIKSRTIRIIYTNEIREKLDKIGEMLDE